MAKKVDDNGYITYENVLISREGVFDYAGYQIDPSGEKLESNKVYKVYRPQSEVCRKEFVESLNNKPLIDDHTMLGSLGEDAEKKGVQGSLTDVKAVGNELYGTITVWSSSLQKKISAGKRELSLGYTGYFRPHKGVFEGQPYSFIQYGLMANHIALVDDARMGHACRVTDSAVVICDSLELPEMANDIKQSCADSVIEQLKGCSDEEIAKVADYLKGLKEEKPGENVGDVKPEGEDAPKGEGDEKPDEPKGGEVADEGKDGKDDGEKKDEKPTEDAEPAKEDEPVKDEKPDDKADEVEDQKAIADAAIAEYRKAEALAKRCEPLFGTIVMDGLYTEADVAKKVCSMDSALRFVGEGKEVDALGARLKEFEKVNGGKKIVVADSRVSVERFDFQAAFRSRK